MKKNNHDIICVLIDFQEKLFHHMHGKEQLLDSAQRLIQGLVILDIPIIWNEQYPKGLGPTVPSLAQHLEGSTPITKNTFSCCSNNEFNQQLESSQRQHVLLLGIEAHVCVYQTARDLLSSGYTVDVISDCVSSRKQQDAVTALNRLDSLGAGIMSYEMILFDMLSKAEGEPFKSISRLVK